MKSVLTIAGSDPSGGAGIQCDLRIIGALGVAGFSAITALTVQNSQGVRSVHPVDADILGAQIAAILEDATDLGAVKIGMLGGAAQVRVVAEMLRRYRPPNVVLDPILASSGGVPLLDAEGIAALLTELMPLCDLITPNAPEAAALTGMQSVHTPADVYEAAGRLMRAGAKSVLIKGGHLLELKARDYLFHPRQIEPRVLTRVEWPGRDLHGTGCFLSSGIAAFLALGFPDWSAVHAAKGELSQAMTMPIAAGNGRGYPDIFVSLGREISTHEERLRKFRGLYVLTDPDLRPDRSHEDIARAAIEGGAKIIQFRDKHLPTPRLMEQACRVQSLVPQNDSLFIVNDRIDVAIAAQADGVHLGPDDAPPWRARQILGYHKLIGVSVSSVEEINEREAWDASYFAVGAIFGSATKHDAGDAVGVDRIREIKAAYPNKPIVAIGGINASNIASVIEAGADAAAVISAVVCAPDMVGATASLCRTIAAVQRDRV